MKTAIWSYTQGSASARKLAQSLGIKIIKHNNSKFKFEADKQIINWGASNPDPKILQCQVLNHPDNVKIASNKLLTFQLLTNNTSIPKWTTTKEEALSWNAKVVVRHKLEGHSGEGIEIVGKEQPLPNAPLYTQYIPKDAEYRIHCMHGTIIFEQRKIRDPNKDPINWQVRSHANGFIFQYTNLNVPDAVREAALCAYTRSNLDFGAVDVIYVKSTGQAYVLEINTACGLEGATVQAYSNAFRQFYLTDN